MLNFEIKQYRVQISLRAKRPWSYFKIHKSREVFNRHLVWGKLSVVVDTPDLDEVQVCPFCEAEVEHLGEDGISFCAEDCGCIEGEKAHYITLREFENR